MIEKEKNLKDYLKELGSVAVAFSGGTDSAYLLYTASLVLKEVCAITVELKGMTQKEKEFATNFCKDYNINQIIIPIDELKIPGFRDNPKDRCYLCKKYIFNKILDEAKKRDIKQIIEGSNKDDLNDYRPGMRAIKELGVISPLMDIGLEKKEIRELSKKANLLSWDVPSSPCLSTRIPYGEIITEKKLNMAGKAETVLNHLNIIPNRVRVSRDTAIIEVYKANHKEILEKYEDISTNFSKIGFKKILLNLDGLHKLL